MGYSMAGNFRRAGAVRTGFKFKVFTPNNSPGLPSSRILKLFEDQQGTLWIATEEGYLVRYADNRFQVYSPPSDRQSGPVTSKVSRRRETANYA